MPVDETNTPKPSDESTRSAPPLSRKKRLVFRLFLLGASGLLVLIVGEVGFRAHSAYERHRAFADADFADDIWAAYDPVLGYRLNPRYGDHSEAGFRDRPLPPPSDKLRVVILGDSLGYYGDTVDDTYVRYLETTLRNGDKHASIELINTSVKGYTTHQEVLFLEQDGVALQPDVVGIAFVLNDVHEFLHRFQHRDGRIIRVEMYHFSEEASADRPQWLDSQFLRWISYRLELGDAATRYMVAGVFPFEYRVDISSAWKEERWPVVQKALERFKRLGAELGFAPFIVMFPMEFQYDEGLLAANRERLLQPQARLAALSDQLEIPFLDLYPIMSPEHFREDGLHLSAEGRAAVAAPIAAFMRREGLVPANQIERPGADELELPGGSKGTIRLMNRSDASRSTGETS